MNDKEFLIALVGIIFSIISGALTGGYALLRQLKADKVGQQNKAVEHRIDLDAALWGRANDTMDDLREQVESQGKRIKALEEALDKANEHIRALEDENEALREILANGKG